MIQKNIRQGQLLAVITANDSTGPYHVRLYVNGGETATLLTRTSKTLTGAYRAANRLFTQHAAQ